MIQKYPSDITREQFKKIEPMLESVRKQTKPRTMDLYEIFCAVLYILKTGCQWRMLPNDFPKWQIVYYYFQLWKKVNLDTNTSVLEDVLKKNGWRYSYKQWSER
jgi:transposase